MGNIKVSLVDYTGKSDEHEGPAHYAAALLAFTKNTRLQMSPDGFRFWYEKHYEGLMIELAYMASTIPSSWEFVDLTFSIENVTRACAQQITRTRTASFAMQSQRVTDVSEMGFRVPPHSKRPERIDLAATKMMATYATLIGDGEEPEDARAVLPMNIQCNLLAKYNLRNWIDVIKARQSLRAQDEYREVADQMVAAVLEVYPWARLFLVPAQHKAINIIEEIAATLPTDQKRALAKAADLIRKG